MEWFFPGIFAVALALTLFVVPLVVILHYVTKWKSTKGLTDEEQRMLESLWRDSERMESRLNSLETILDDEAPSWRKRV